MNEAETRAELIDPALAAAGWGVVEDSRIRREYPITVGRIQPGGQRAKALFADYVLVYRGKKLATIEAKSDEFLDKESFQEIFSSVKKDLALKGKALFMGVRVVLTGRDHGPELGDLVPLIPLDVIIKRMESL